MLFYCESKFIGTMTSQFSKENLKKNYLLYNVFLILEKIKYFKNTTFFFVNIFSTSNQLLDPKSHSYTTLIFTV